MRTAFVFVALSMVATLVCAKEYLGFNVCGSSTSMEVTNRIEKTGARVSEVSEASEEDLLTIVSSPDFAVADISTRLYVYLYRDRVVKLQLGNASQLSELIDAKYGSVSRKTVVNDGFSTVTTFWWDVRSDPSITLGQQVSQINRSTGATGYALIPSSSIVYTCKSLWNQFESEKNGRKQRADQKKAEKGKL